MTAAAKPSGFFQRRMFCMLRMTVVATCGLEIKADFVEPHIAGGLFVLRCAGLAFAYASLWGATAGANRVPRHQGGGHRRSNVRSTWSALGQTDHRIVTALAFAACFVQHPFPAVIDDGGGLAHGRAAIILRSKRPCRWRRSIAPGRGWWLFYGSCRCLWHGSQVQHSLEIGLFFSKLSRL
jgi:hypothetical protein